VLLLLLLLPPLLPLLLLLLLPLLLLLLFPLPLVAFYRGYSVALVIVDFRLLVNRLVILLLLGVVYIRFEFNFYQYYTAKPTGKFRFRQQQQHQQQTNKQTNQKKEREKFQKKKVKPSKCCVVSSERFYQSDSVHLSLSLSLSLTRRSRITRFTCWPTCFRPCSTRSIAIRENYSTLAKTRTFTKVVPSRDISPSAPRSGYIYIQIRLPKTKTKTEPNRSKRKKFIIFLAAGGGGG